MDEEFNLFDGLLCFLRYRIPDSGCWIPDTGYSILDAGIINEKRMPKGIPQGREKKNEKRLVLFNLDIVIWSRTGGMEFDCIL